MAIEATTGRTARAANIVATIIAHALVVIIATPNRTIRKPILTARLRVDAREGRAAARIAIHGIGRV
jgi:hypothetical protein